MARKIFVSYKHSDSDVQPLQGRNGLLHIPTARDYVDAIEGYCDAEHIYKGERADEDLSRFKDSTIASQLRDQIFDSSVTLVLISPNMRELAKPEDDQWIPWEISFSLKETTRSDRTSRTNAILAVVLPDANGSYSHFIVDHTCAQCDSRTIKNDKTFTIIGGNMFNHKQIVATTCQGCNSYNSRFCYIHTVEWNKFVAAPDESIDTAVAHQADIDNYDVQKII